MKKLILVLIPMMYFFHLEAQNFELGVNFGTGVQTKSGLFNSEDFTYNDKLYNPALVSSISLNYFINEGKYLSLQARINNRQTMYATDGNMVNTIDKMFKIPIQFHYRTKFNENVFWDFGLGPNIGILTKQIQITSDENKTEFGFGSYSDIGISSSMHFGYLVENKIGFKLGLYSDFDVYDLSVKENVFKSKYGTGLLEAGLIIKF
jgi:hypothetical protein